MVEEEGEDVDEEGEDVDEEGEAVDVEGGGVVVGPDVAAEEGEVDAIEEVDDEEAVEGGRPKVKPILLKGEKERI